MSPVSSIARMSPRPQPRTFGSRKVLSTTQSVNSAGPSPRVGGRTRGRLESSLFHNAVGRHHNGWAEENSPVLLLARAATLPGAPRRSTGALVLQRDMAGQRQHGFSRWRDMSRILIQRVLLILGELGRSALSAELVGMRPLKERISDQRREGKPRCESPHLASGLLPCW